MYEQLSECYPDAHCELNHRNPFELLVATVLSAQTTDQRVNSVTEELFRRWPDARHLAAAGALVDSDPETAYQHALAARARASRLAVVREAAELDLVLQEVEEVASDLLRHLVRGLERCVAVRGIGLDDSDDLADVNVDVRAADPVADLVEQAHADTVSLYVNDYNAPALATYRRIGMERVGTFATILL